MIKFHLLLTALVLTTLAHAGERFIDVDNLAKPYKKVSIPQPLVDCLSTQKLLYHGFDAWTLSVGSIVCDGKRADALFDFMAPDNLGRILDAKKPSTSYTIIPPSRDTRGEIFETRFRKGYFGMTSCTRYPERKNKPTICTNYAGVFQGLVSLLEGAESSDHPFYELSLYLRACVMGGEYKVYISGESWGYRPMLGVKCDRTFAGPLFQKIKERLDAILVEPGPAEGISQIGSYDEKNGRIWFGRSSAEYRDALSSHCTEDYCFISLIRPPGYL